MYTHLLNSFEQVVKPVNVFLKQKRYLCKTGLDQIFRERCSNIFQLSSGTPLPTFYTDFIKVKCFVLFVSLNETSISKLCLLLNGAFLRPEFTSPYNSYQ